MPNFTNMTGLLKGFGVENEPEQKSIKDSLLKSTSPTAGLLQMNFKKECMKMQLVLLGKTFQ